MSKSGGEKKQHRDLQLLLVVKSEKEDRKKGLDTHALTSIPSQAMATAGPNCTQY